MAPQSKSNQRSQLRRNERERKRVHQVNDGFDQLRCRVPKATANKKLSKADTLREAVKYIKHLQSLLNNPPVYNSCANRPVKMEYLPSPNYCQSPTPSYYTQQMTSSNTSPTFSEGSVPAYTSSCVEQQQQQQQHQQQHNFHYGFMNEGVYM